MSGLIKAVKKVFKTVVVNPIKAVAKGIKSVAMKIWHTPILRYIAIAAAIYFTAGAAMTYFGGASAAGATAGAVTAGEAGVAAGTTSFAAGAAAGAATAAGTTAAAAAGATTLSAVTVTATVGSAAAATTASTIAAASVGAAAGMAVANAASSSANAATTQGNGAVTGTPAGLSGTTTSGVPISQLPGVNVTADIPASSTVGAGVSSDIAGYAADLSLMKLADSNGMAGPAKSVQTDVSRVDPNQNPDGSPKSLFQRGKDWVAKEFGGSGSPGAIYDENGALNTDGIAAGPAAAPAAAKAGMSSFEKVLLLKSAVDLAGGYFRPTTQPQYSGRNPNGTGYGVGIHTVNGGFGLATGGSEPSPSGVPANLRPPGNPVGSAGQYQSLSNAALATGGTQGQAGNIGQAVANSAGVGGLVPQGAVNFMGNRRG